MCKAVAAILVASCLSCFAEHHAIADTGPLTVIVPKSTIAIGETVSIVIWPDVNVEPEGVIYVYLPSGKIETFGPITPETTNFSCQITGETEGATRVPVLYLGNRFNILAHKEAAFTVKERWQTEFWKRLREMICGAILALCGVLIQVQIGRHQERKKNLERLCVALEILRSNLTAVSERNERPIITRQTDQLLIAAQGLAPAAIGVVMQKVWNIEGAIQLWNSSLITGPEFSKRVNAYILEIFDLLKNK